MMTTEERALQVPCGRCEAKIGERCMTITGKRATHPHSARMQPFYDEWTSGYQEGNKDMHQTLSHELLVRGTPPAEALEAARRWL